MVKKDNAGLKGLISDIKITNKSKSNPGETKKLRQARWKYYQK